MNNILLTNTINLVYRQLLVCFEVDILFKQIVILFYCSKLGEKRFVVSIKHIID